jgi:succinate-acetate transporter protein
MGTCQVVTELGMFKELIVITLEKVMIFLKMLFTLLPIRRIVAEGHVTASAGVELIFAAIPTLLKKRGSFPLSGCSWARPAHMVLFHVLV